METFFLPFPGPILSAVIGALVGALLVQLSTRWVCDFKPSYGSAFLACLLAYLASAVTATALGLGFGMHGPGRGPGMLLLIPIAAFLVGALVYGQLLKRPSGEAIGFAKGVLVSLITSVLGAFAFGLFAIALMAMMMPH